MDETSLNNPEIADDTIPMGEYLFRNRGEAAKIQLTDGKWDKSGNTYTTEDKSTGIITEYHVKKNSRVATGNAVYERSYKVINNEKVAVKYDAKQNVWVQKGALTQLDEKFEYTNPRLMGTLVIPPGKNDSTFTLQLERARPPHFSFVKAAIGVPGGR